MRYVLTIAGSDSLGGAGIQADIRTIASLGAHPLTAVTALTAQNSFGIAAIHRIPAVFLEQQVESILQDISPHAVKMGMLFSAANVRMLSRIFKRHRLQNLVLDPVLKATTGRPLIDPGAIPILKRRLIPLVSVITPNLEEASFLCGRNVSTLAEMEEAAVALKEMGPDVIITGGHLKDACVDLLFDGKEMVHFRSRKIASEHTHGTGCVFSSALATFLAMTGDMKKAVEKAHGFTHQAILKGYACGRGAGPVCPTP